MSAELEALANLLEVSEGITQSELLFSFPLPYEVVLKYEVMREKTLEKVGLYHSSAKIWKMQRDANNKVKLKSCKTDFEDIEKFTSEYVSRLETSHEITLKYARFIEENLYSLHKLYAKAYILIDQNPLSPLKFSSKLEELELIRYKDISRLKEMEVIELRLLDQLSQRYVHKEADLLVLIERIKDKLSYYDHSVIVLEQQMDAVKQKYESNIDEMEAKLQEMKLKNTIQSESAERLKDLKSQQTNEMHEWIKEENKALTLQNTHLKSSIEELTRSEKQTVDKYTHEIERLYDENESLRRIIKSNEKEDINLEKNDKNKVSVKKYKEIITTIKEITHNVFLKYGKSQSEWNDPHWKEELNNYSGEYGDLLVEIEFLCYMIVKLSSDNDWLVDRLAELGKEYHKLRDDGRSPTPNRLKEEVINDLRAASNALKEFEEARDKLMSQFS